MDTYGGTAVKVFVGGKHFIWAVSAEVRTTIHNLKSDILGLFRTYEVIPNGMSVSCSLSGFHVVDKSLTSLGIWPTGDNMTMITWPESYLEIYQTITGKVVRKVEGLRCESDFFSSPRPSHVTNRLTFIGTNVVDESPGSIAAQGGF